MNNFEKIKHYFQWFPSEDHLWKLDLWKLVEEEIVRNRLLIHQKFQTYNFLRLPKDLIQNLFQYLSYVEQMRLRRVNSHWNRDLNYDFEGKWKLYEEKKRKFEFHLVKIFEISEMASPQVRNNLEEFSVILDSELSGEHKTLTFVTRFGCIDKEFAFQTWEKAPFQTNYQKTSDVRFFSPQGLYLWLNRENQFFWTSGLDIYSGVPHLPVGKLSVSCCTFREPYYFSVSKSYYLIGFDQLIHRTISTFYVVRKKDSQIVNVSSQRSSRGSASINDSWLCFRSNPYTLNFCDLLNPNGLILHTEKFGEPIVNFSLTETHFFVLTKRFLYKILL